MRRIYREISLDEQNYVNKKCERKIANIFLPTNLNIYCGCSKERSH